MLMSGDQPDAELCGFHPSRDFVSLLKGFVSELGPLAPWREFCTVPHASSPRTFRRLARDLLRTTLAGSYAYLSESPIHDLALRRLHARAGPRAALLFRFLCLSTQVEESNLAEIVSIDHISRYVERGLFLRRGRQLLLPVTLVPWGDSYYISEALEVVRNRATYQIRPAHVSHETSRFASALRARFRNRGLKTMLEMGTGIGIVALDMGEVIPRREGAEIYDRNLEFALANRELRGDADVTFYSSDLFSNVKGRYDLIVFNPWQPAEGSIETILRFLDEAPGFLADDGSIYLTISSGFRNGRDAVTEQIAEVLRRRSLRAVREVFASEIVVDADGGRCVVSSADLTIERNRTGASRGTAIENRVGLRGVAALARRTLLEVALEHEARLQDRV
jgi:hypothetical protein